MNIQCIPCIHIKNQCKKSICITKYIKIDTTTYKTTNIKRNHFLFKPTNYLYQQSYNTYHIYIYLDTHP